MASHAANPLPLVMESTVRVFFSCRDESQRSHVGFVDLDPGRGFEVVRISEKPVMGPGVLGTFDDSGVSLGCLLRTNEALLLFYMGWNLKVTVPFGNAIGVAWLSNGGEAVERRLMAPILDRSEDDPFTLSYPFVLPFGSGYRMYYGSSLGWGEGEPAMSHVIKYADSQDALKWTPGGVAIGFKDEEEYALSRPWVFRLGNQFHMLFSKRSHGEPSTYRIGHAVSLDGSQWERRDSEVGIDVAENGWDSEMIGYPAVFKYDETHYLLYAGNGYGNSGFGLAQLLR